MSDGEITKVPKKRGRRKVRHTIGLEMVESKEPVESDSEPKPRRVTRKQKELETSPIVKAKRRGRKKKVEATSEQSTESTESDSVEKPQKKKRGRKKKSSNSEVTSSLNETEKSSDEAVKKLSVSNRVKFSKESKNGDAETSKTFVSTPHPKIKPSSSPVRKRRSKSAEHLVKKSILSKTTKTPRSEAVRKSVRFFNENKSLVRSNTFTLNDTLNSLEVLKKHSFGNISKPKDPLSKTLFPEEGFAKLEEVKENETFSKSDSEEDEIIFKPSTSKKNDSCMMLDDIPDLSSVASPYYSTETSPEASCIVLEDTYEEPKPRESAPKLNDKKAPLKDQSVVNNRSFNNKSLVSSTPFKGTGTVSGSKKPERKFKTKIPNFALIHKKAMDKLESIQDMTIRKAERAQALLSGKKPTTSGLKKRSPKTSAVNSGPNSKKQLVFSNKLLKPDIKPKPIKNSPKRVEANKFGFKATERPKKENLVKAVMTKSKVTENTRQTRREDMKGVRTNRRFELLMKMRNK